MLGERGRSVAVMDVTKTNPYRSPSETEFSVHEEGTTIGEVSDLHSGCITLLIAMSIVTLTCLIQYMALDYCVVRLRPKPRDATAYDWTIMFFPFPCAMILLLLSFTKVLKLDLSLGVAAWVFGMILAIPVMATVGVWFHFAIGGTL